MADERQLARDLGLLVAGAVIALCTGAITQGWAAHVQDERDSGAARRTQQAEAEAAMWQISDIVNAVLASAERVIAATDSSASPALATGQLARFNDQYENWRAKRIQVGVLLTVYFPDGLMSLAQTDTELSHIHFMMQTVVADRLAAVQLDRGASTPTQRTAVAAFRAAAKSLRESDMDEINGVEKEKQLEQGFFSFMIQSRLAGTLDPDAVLPPSEAAGRETSLRTHFKHVTDSIAAAKMPSVTRSKGEIY